MDDCWHDNVGPLLEALKELNVDPVAWAAEPDFQVFHRDLSQFPIHEDRGRMSLIDFACGYLQATGNLTGRSWQEQIREGLKHG